MKKNLITVLKKLLAAFGGEETSSDNAVEVIDKIADAANGVTEKELPEATAEDVGKAVMVNENGGYALGEAGGGPLIAKITQSGAYTYKCSMTSMEIIAAYQQGKTVIVETPFISSKIACSTLDMDALGKVRIWFFYIPGGTTGQITYMEYSIDSTGTATQKSVNIKSAT